MKSTTKLIRSGGHRRGDLWTSGKRTTLYHKDLHDQMVVAQTAEESRIAADSKTPADVARMKNTARTIREHYTSTVEHLGVQPQTVNNSGGGGALTNRPSFLGPTLTTGYAGEPVSLKAIDVAHGIRKDQFIYYDDEGRRIQHPMTAQALADAGLATSEELNERLAMEYQKALAEKKRAELVSPSGGNSLEEGASATKGLLTNAETPAPSQSSHDDGSVGGEAVRDGAAGGDVTLHPASSTTTHLSRSGDKSKSFLQPREEVAAMTTVRDKRDLLYNQKLRPLWDAAHEDPVRGSGFRGPKRNIDNGSVVVRGTHHTADENMRRDQYYDDVTTIAQSRTTSMGQGLRASERSDGLGPQDHLQSTNVFGLGEEAFRLSMLNKAQRALEQQQQSQKVEGEGEEAGTAAAAAAHADSVNIDDSLQTTNDASSAPPSQNKHRNPYISPMRKHYQEDEPVTSAQLDPKYASQHIDLNSPRVGPEFYKGADIALDADLRKALDERMRARREGGIATSVPSVSKILMDADRRDGIDTRGAVTEGLLDEAIERHLDLKAARLRLEKEKEKGEGDAAKKGEGETSQATTHQEGAAPPSNLNLAGPRRSATRKRRNSFENASSVSSSSSPNSAEASSPSSPSDKNHSEQSSSSTQKTAIPITSKISSLFGGLKERWDARRLREEQEILEEERAARLANAALEEELLKSGEATRKEDDEEMDRKTNERLGIRNTRATPSNSPVGRRKPVTYDSAKEMSADKLLLHMVGAGVELNVNATDSRALFNGGWDAFGERRKGNNSYTEASNAGGRFSNRLVANYFANDQLHAGMQASSKFHSGSATVSSGGDSGGLGPAAVRNRAFGQFQKQAREDPYGAARNINVGAGGLSAVGGTQASGGSGVGSTFSQSAEGQKSANQFTFRQILKQLDHSRMQPVNHNDMFGDSLKYLEAYVDMSGLVMSAEGPGSSVNVTDDSSADVLLPRAALKGRMVGLLFYTDSERCKLFMERLSKFNSRYRGDFVVLGMSFGAFERRDLMRRHRFGCVPTNLGARFVARDAGFTGTWWQPYPSLFIADGSTGRVVSKNGYASIMRNPHTCFDEWVNGNEGADLMDIVLSRFDLMPHVEHLNTRDPLTERVLKDFNLKEKWEQ